MSGIAGIVNFDGASVQPQLLGKMTAALTRRGPDGTRHWVKDSVGLGHCMFRTTPESLEETQPLTNEDESLVLVMDGRVDNWEDLRRELLVRGSVLRDRSDAELVLRAYEIWGENCPNQIIGEFVFFVWDARQRQLFSARDAAGTRHFYFHKGNGWFAFASEIKGLLALERIEARLNDSRVLDYLVEEFSRDDEIGTFYQDIDRIPAGHSMRVTAQDVKVWRYWNPGVLPAMSFASLDECAEALLAQLRIAIKCRLRTIGPVGASLSGGLDSSSIVGLISKEFRNELSERLRTFSLIRHDRDNCPDWLSSRHMLKDHFLEPTVITSDISAAVCRTFLDNVSRADEPFISAYALFYFINCEAAAAHGCRIFFDGMAGDLVFYGYERTLDVIFRRKLYGRLPAVLAAFKRHGVPGGGREAARKWLASVAPEAARVAYRRLRDGRTELGNDLKLLSPEIAKQLLERKMQRSCAESNSEPSNDQLEHARVFTSGLLSFPHENNGQIALSRGVEPRSPFSDRRMIEFAIQMPVEAKLFSSWYKHCLRKSMNGILPEEVRWRRIIGGHPGWKFYESIMKKMAQIAPQTWDDHRQLMVLDKWIDLGAIEKMKKGAPTYNGYLLYRGLILSRWLRERKFLTF